jgi:deoxyribonuclease (pyrimidine dimer)
MTRINASIQPYELSNSMLFAEYREIKRVANKAKNNKYDFSKPVPNEFCLNRGHESFFRDKILYLSKRSDALYIECLKRGIKAEDYSESYKNIPTHLFNDWRETKNSRKLLKERINLRLTESKQIIRFYDKVVKLEEALIK